LPERHIRFITSFSRMVRYLFSSKMSHSAL